MMRGQLLLHSLVLAICLFVVGCAKPGPIIPVDDRSVNPGSEVTRGGSVRLSLLGEPLSLDEPVPDITLVDTSLKGVSLADFKGSVLLVSIVPSLDTQVCERQTHILGEAAEKLPPGVRAITISRDLPFAQQRFADETGFDRVYYMSDFQQAAFGRGTGLLVDQLFLLARSVMLVDRDGMVRYLQVVPEISHLPDLEKAISFAVGLAK